jgi:hypothetical protein
MASIRPQTVSVGIGGIFYFSGKATPRPEKRRVVLTQSTQPRATSTSPSLICDQLAQQNCAYSILSDFTAISPQKWLFLSYLSVFISQSFGLPLSSPLISNKHKLRTSPQRNKLKLRPNLVNGLIYRRASTTA